MKVLFVSSGRKGEVSELIKNQGDSIADKGINISYFIFKKGLLGYLSGIYPIYKLVKNEKIDLVHAHYSLSAFCASLAGNFPIVVSLLGSDAFKSGFMRWMTYLFYKYRWGKTIVKTKQMKDILKMDKAEIIPNGVDLSRFRPMPREEARQKLGITPLKKLVIFVSDPSRDEKNFNLAVSAVQHLGNEDVQLLSVYNVENEKIPYYLNASDTLLLTSKREGSVNVVKEAMSCNIPVVSTDVGDVRENTRDLPGCFICDPTPESLSTSLSIAIEMKQLTKSRERIIDLNLDSDSVAYKIIKIYHKVINDKK